MKNSAPRSLVRSLPLHATLLALAATGCAAEQEDSHAEMRERAQASRLHREPVFVGSGCGDHDEEHSNEHDTPDVRKRAHHVVRWRKPGHHGPKLSKIKVLGFNDFHGQLAARTVSSRPAGGAAVLGAYLKDAEERAEDGALIIHAGDHVGASPPSSALLQDEPSIEFLNLLANRHCRGARHDEPKCNVVGTLGNHEFDEGKGEMLRLIYGGNHASGPFLTRYYRGAEFGYISANVVDEKSGKTILPPYTIRHVGKVDVGIIGAVLTTTPTIVTPTGVAGLDFLDEADSINRYVRLLKKKGIETIGVTIHQGGRQTSYEGPTTEAGAVSGDILPIVQALDSEVDFVISGHAHTFTNALIENDEGTPILVTQAFSASTAYGELDLTIDLRSGEVVEKSASIITTYADVAPGTTPDQEIAELVAAAEEETAPLVSQIVSSSATEITRTESSAGESALGNLIADAQRWATGAEIACMNPGGIRADLNAGEVTWGELFTIQPFGNSLVAMDLTGAQVVSLLKQQWVGQTFARILKCSGLRYSWDPTLPAEGDRLSNIQVAGSPLDLARVYRVTVNSFMAAGGDNFTVLVNGVNRVGGDVDLDALIDYIETLAEPFSSAIEGRITLTAAP